MNWRSISFDWNQVRAFLATAEEGSFSAAARALGSTQPTLGRQVTALEESLGVTLFERAGRSLRLTGPGREMLAHVRAMGDAAMQMSLTAAGQAQNVEGEVSVTCTDLFAEVFLPDILRRLRREAPGIRIQIVASNALQDLTRREADIAIRHVRPEQPDLIARNIGDFAAGLYAATGYLDARGRPERIEDLAGHDFIGGANAEEFVGYLASQGITAAPDEVKISCDSGAVMWELMVAGLGITIMVAGLERDSTRIERLLPDVFDVRFPTWITAHRELHTSRRVRMVFDALAEALSAVAKGMRR